MSISDEENSPCVRCAIADPKKRQDINSYTIFHSGDIDLDLWKPSPGISPTLFNLAPPKRNAPHHAFSAPPRRWFVPLNAKRRIRSPSSTAKFGLSFSGMADQRANSDKPARCANTFNSSDSFEVIHQAAAGSSAVFQTFPKESLSP